VFQSGSCWSFFPTSFVLYLCFLFVPPPISIWNFTTKCPSATHAVCFWLLTRSFPSSAPPGFPLMSSCRCQPHAYCSKDPHLRRRAFRALPFHRVTLHLTAVVPWRCAFWTLVPFKTKMSSLLTSAIITDLTFLL
jgi:hypothetical protein